MLKKMSVLCLLVCFILSLGVFRAAASDTYGNFSGSGTEAEPFLIGTPQEMAALIDLTNDNTDEAKYYLGADGVPKYFKITADLDMQDYPINGYGIGVYGKEYCTINISSHFDGGNHVIKNLTMTHDSHALGLFGQVYGGSIKNLGLENAKLTSTHAKISRAGFIALDTRGGSSAVDHCYVINSTLSVSAVTGSVIGGIVGNNNLEAVTNCYTLNNTYPDMTGIEVSFGSIIGGGVGRASNCYSDVAPIAGGAKYSSSNAAVTYTVGENGTLQRNGVSVPKTEIVPLGELTYTVVPEDNRGYTVTVNGVETAVTDNQFTVKISEITEISVVFQDLRFWGSGTESDPFLIQTPQDLATLIDVTNDNTDEAKYYLGTDGVPKYFKITADLDMQDYPINGYGIGVYGKEYCTINVNSHFDGGNHVIKNLTMTHDSHALGLFGQVYGGSIKNLGLENAKLTSTHAKISRAGFIAVDTRGGSSVVDHCYVINSTLSVSAVTGSVIGGIVGNNNLEAVTNCYTLNNTYPDMTGIEASFGSIIGGGVGRASNCYSDVAPIAGGAKYSSSNAAVTYTVGENGTLQRNGVSVPKTEIVPLGELTYTVVPDDNYKYTVTVNGSEVATDANHQFAVTVSEATEIIVSFEIKNHVYPGIASAVSFVTGEYAGYPSIVAYSKLNAFTTGETGLEYGMKIWQDEEQQLVLPMYQTNEVLDQATPNQSFAIRVFGEAIVTGKRYFMQPYVGETEGEAKEITIE